MYAGRKRRKPVQNQKSVKPVNVDGIKSNPSKRHRDRLNSELERLAGLLPFAEDVTSSLDKLSILRLSVSYLRSKTFFRVAFKNHSCNKIADGYGNHGNGKMPGLVDGILPEGELLLQALNGFVLVVTADGVIFYVSPTVQDYLGFHQTDVMHQSVFELIHVKDQQEFRRNLHWALNPPEANKGRSGERVASTSVIPCGPEQLPPENTSFFERNFICQFRCLLDNSSGFLALNVQGRLRFLHGQNRKAEDGTPIPPQLALFALAAPLQATSILEVRTKNMIFRTKHKLDFTPVACDAKGKIVLGYTEAELRARGTGYQFIHAADMLHCAENHVRMIKTGESGLTVFRLLTKDNRWAWVQANARLVYKNGRPDYIIVTQRPLVDEEGGEELHKRAQHQRFSFATGEALLYQITTSSNPGQPDLHQAKGKSGRGRKSTSGKTEKQQKSVDPSSLLGAMMQQDESVYVCHPASEPRYPLSSSSFRAAADSGDTAGCNWQLVPGDTGQPQDNGRTLDPLLATLDSLNLVAEDNCLNSDLFRAIENLGLGADDLELLLYDERMVRVETDPDYVPTLNDIMTNGEILSYIHDSMVTNNDQGLSGNHQPYPLSNFPQAANMDPTASGSESLSSSQDVPRHHPPLLTQHQALSQPQQNNRLWDQHTLPCNAPRSLGEPTPPLLKVRLHTECQFEPTTAEQVVVNGVHSLHLADPQPRDGHQWRNYVCPSTAVESVPYRLDPFRGYGIGQNVDSYQQPVPSSLAPTQIGQEMGYHMDGTPYMELTMTGDSQYRSFLTTSSTFQASSQKQPAQGTLLCQHPLSNPSTAHFVDHCPEELQPTADLYGLFSPSLAQDGSQKEENCVPSTVDVAYPDACVHPGGNVASSDNGHPYTDVFANPPLPGYYIQ
ncbi:aryl hydrocarbon receptor 1b isoform X1 [Rhinoraja longicauda]